MICTVGEALLISFLRATSRIRISGCIVLETGSGIGHQGQLMYSASVTWSRAWRRLPTPPSNPHLRGPTDLCSVQSHQWRGKAVRDPAQLCDQVWLFSGRNVQSESDALFLPSLSFGKRSSPSLLVGNGSAACDRTYITFVPGLAGCLTSQTNLLRVLFLQVAVVGLYGGCNDDPFQFKSPRHI